MINKKYKAVLWDIDGTLVDSEPLHDEAVFYALNKMGISLPDQSLDMLGTTWVDTWDAVGGVKCDLKTFEDHAAAYYLDRCNALKARSYVVDLIKAFNKQGVLQATVSNSRRDIVSGNLMHLQVLDLMAAIVSFGDSDYGKPHPAPYLEGAKRLDLLPEVCIAVEDSPRGVQSAKRAGCLAIFWPQDVSAHSQVADFTIRNLEDFDWEGNLGISIPKNILQKGPKL